LIAARRSLIERWLRDEGLRGPALAAGVVSEMTERRRLAESVRRRALAAADFAAVARQWSDDPGSREVGGDLGRFSRNIHPAAFDRVAFSLVPGQISPVIETEYGFHIIRVTSHEPERLLRLDELRATLHDRLQGRKR
jgi:parvulin-like peptidyl-prolyl isomerase